MPDYVELLRREGIEVHRDEDFEPEGPPKRILLPLRELSRQLHCDRELIACYLRNRVLEESGFEEHERRGRLGLTAEELSGFALAGYVVKRVRRIDPLRAFRLAAEAVAELYVTFPPGRVKFCVLEGNRKWEFKVISGRGVLEIPQSIRPWMTVVDVTLLSDLMEEAMERAPLNLPRVERSITQS